MVLWKSQGDDDIDDGDDNDNMRSWWFAYKKISYLNILATAQPETKNKTKHDCSWNKSLETLLHRNNPGIYVCIRTTICTYLKTQSFQIT